VLDSHRCKRAVAKRVKRVKGKFSAPHMAFLFVSAKCDSSFFSGLTSSHPSLCLSDSSIVRCSGTPTALSNSVFGEVH